MSTQQRYVWTSGPAGTITAFCRWLDPQGDLWRGQAELAHRIKLSQSGIYQLCTGARQRPQRRTEEAMTAMARRLGFTGAGPCTAAEGQG